MTHSTLVVGIGSDHADDQFGWLVARTLMDGNPQAYEVRMARTPCELLGWLDDREQLILCDACIGAGHPGTIQRWVWPANEFQQVGWSGTHDIALPGVLSLADRFGWLPRVVVIWGMEATGTAQRIEASSLALQSAAIVADAIRAELTAGSVDGGAAQGELTGDSMEHARHA